MRTARVVHPARLNLKTIMKPSTNNEEPLLVIILKSISLLSAIAAVVCLGKVMLGGAPPSGAEDVTIARAALEHAVNFNRAITAAGASLGLWWMACVLSLLNRIANKDGNPAPQTVVRVSPGSQTEGKSKPLPRVDGDAGSPPKYEL